MKIRLILMLVLTITFPLAGCSASADSVENDKIERELVKLTEENKKLETSLGELKDENTELLNSVSDNRAESKSEDLTGTNVNAWIHSYYPEDTDIASSDNAIYLTVKSGYTNSLESLMSLYYSFKESIQDYRRMWDEGQMSDILAHDTIYINYIDGISGDVMVGFRVIFEDYITDVDVLVDSDYSVDISSAISSASQE